MTSSPLPRRGMARPSGRSAVGPLHYCAGSVPGENGGMRILVATASTYGSTREIGDHIAGVLRRAGHDVHTRDIDAVTTLDYDAIVVGTAIYIGRPLTPARNSTARLDRELCGKPVCVFAARMTNTSRDPLHPPFTEPASRPYPGSPYPILTGKVDPTQPSAAERTLAALTAASVQDERDFPLIERWAQAIADCLAAAPVDAGRCFLPSPDALLATPRARYRNVTIH